MKTEIKIAKTAGFCFGVKRAVDIVLSAADKDSQIATLGPIIHNTEMVRYLEQRGVYAIESPDEAEGRTVIIRSHGVARSVYDYLEERKINYIDATCPFVANIHKIASECCNEDMLIIAGDREHPEVKGIIGHCTSDFAVIKDSKELENLLNKGKIDKYNIKMLSQTTFNVSEWEKCCSKLKKVYTNAKIFDTICKATSLRQQEAAMLADDSDIAVVIGDRRSSNTKKLYDICKEKTKTVWVQTKADILEKDLLGCERVSVTAGASTPAWIIKEVHETMSEILENQNQEEQSFEEMLNESFKSTYNGEKVTAVVTGIKPNEISVDIGTKHAGYVPLNELTEDPNAKPEDIVSKGDKLELLVVRVNDVEGTVMLSKKRLDAQAGFEKVMNAAETGEVLEGVVTEVIKGGVLALTNGVKVFIPASHATLSRNEPLEELLKKKVSFKILEVNRHRRRAVGSIRLVVKEQRKEQEAKFWDAVEVGKHYDGVVKSLTDYGAFVDLGGVDGMVHISELSWGKIRHPSQVVKVGDKINVFVKDIDTEKKKISLGYKKDEDNPWEILKSKYSVGDVAKVKIVSLTSFGAFAELIPGIDGLIHISQISTQRIEKPADVLSVGQEVEVKITEIDYDANRISLSIRALLEEEPKEEASDNE